MDEFKMKAEMFKFYLDGIMDVGSEKVNISKKKLMMMLDIIYGYELKLLVTEQHSSLCENAILYPEKNSAFITLLKNKRGENQ